MRSQGVQGFWVFLIVVVSLLTMGCSVRNQQLKPVEVAARAYGDQCCPDGDCGAYISTIAHHGAIAEMLNLLVGPVSGDVKQLQQTLRSADTKPEIELVAVYHDSNFFGSYLLATTLSGFEPGELTDVRVCYVGNQKNFARVREAARKAEVPARWTAAVTGSKETDSGPEGPDPESGDGQD
jgi:hypothetical protein